ncbi:hypothetical protein MVEN_00882900 [Mycena venus]|uniref:Uncharacterized protein n=1 Tax=Mycena venus TaxID=2733690 RepID=A0A8H7D4D4_9AGAR|nr:hypothetical protein MVEN_00882900 [Mycena venus]
MFSIKSLLFLSTAVTLLSTAAAQSWEVMVYEGSNSCGDSGGTTLSGTEAGDCRLVGLGNIAGSFAVIQDNDPTPGTIFAFHLFSDNSCQDSLGAAIGPGTCHSGSVGSFIPFLVAG